MLVDEFRRRAQNYFVAEKVKAHQSGSLPLRADLKVLRGLISQERIKLKLFDSRTKDTANNLSCGSRIRS